jgi:putative membrane protein
MMWWYAGNGAWPWWGWVGFLFMIVFWGLLIWAAVALFRYLAAPERERAVPHRAQTAEEILAERFARGEIDADEYQHRLEALQGAPRRAPRNGQPPSAGTDDMVGAAPREQDQSGRWP